MGPMGLQLLTPDSQTFGGIRPAPAGHAYRRGGYRLTPAMPGLRAPAHRDRQPKPRALSGRGGRLGPEFPTLEKQSSKECPGWDLNARQLTHWAVNWLNEQDGYDHDADDLVGRIDAEIQQLGVAVDMLVHLATSPKGKG